MRVKSRHFGRMCRCTRCDFPIYVTYDNVVPRVPEEERNRYHFFGENDVPLRLEEGDVLMELYEVRGEIGRGGMGVVYRVFHREWGIEIALKCPKPVGRASSRWAELFEQECETWIGLAPHPNVVECYYFRSLGGFPRVLMEYVKGSDLERLIAGKALYRGDQVEVLERILDILIQFAYGLHHAHDEGVIHQDVKPSNLLVSLEGLAKVTDFGLATVWAKGSRTPRRIGGTRVYSSPERWSGHDVTAKSDIWCWGVSVVEVFAGEVFWRQGPLASEALELLLQRGARHREIPPMPEAVADLLRRCFKASPEDRPESMLSVANELREIYEDLCGSAYGRDPHESALISEDVLNNRAVSLLDLGKSEAAEEIWSGILENNSEHIEAYYNLNLQYWRTGRIRDNDVVGRLEKMVRNRPDEWSPKYLVARTLIESGRCNEAIDALERLDRVRQNEEGANRSVAFALAVAQSHVDSDVSLVWKKHVGAPVVGAVCIAPCASWLVSGDVNGRIRLWDRESCRVLHNVQAHAGRVFAICINEDGSLIVTGGADGLIKLWDAKSCAPIGVLEGHKNVIRSLALSNNQKWLYSGSRDGTIRVWDVGTQRSIGKMTGHKASVSSISLGGDGRYLVSGSRDKTIRLWDAHNGHCLMTTSPSHRPITGVHLNRTATRAYSIGGRKVKVWDPKTGKIIRTLSPHQTEILSFSVQEDIGFGITSTGNSTKIWRLDTGQCLYTLLGCAPSRLSNDGVYAVTARRGGEICLWAVNAGIARFRAPFVVCRDSAEAES